MPIRPHRCTVQHAAAPSPKHDVPLLVVKPTASARPPAQTPGILWIHGGGYVTGMSQMVFMSRALRLVQRYGAVVVSPARAENLAELPPAYTFVGDVEPFYCETLTYVERLREAGVEAAVDVYPGCFHAFDMLLPFKRVSRQAIATFEERYRYAATHYFAPQP